MTFQDKADSFFAANENVELVVVVDASNKSVLYRKEKHKAAANATDDAAAGSRLAVTTVDTYINLITSVALPFEPTVDEILAEKHRKEGHQLVDAEDPIAKAAVAAKEKSIRSDGEQWGLVRFRTANWDIVGYRTNTSQEASVSDASQRWLMVVFSDARRRDEH